jgi:hypothetical protein
VHDPVSLDTLGRLAPVEHEGLLDPDALAGASGQDGLVGAGGLPVAGSGGAVGASAVGVLAVPRAEEVPLVLPEQGFGCRSMIRFNGLHACSQSMIESLLEKSGQSEKKLKNSRGRSHGLHR